ncbi:MAG TPA: response regulator [Myxococcales bacterium]|nr:response regulator [Myxococcales bacterium]
MSQDIQQIGLILYERGVLDDATLEEALASGETSEVRFLARLLAERRCDEADLVAALAQSSGLPGIDLSRSALALEPLDLVPRAVAETDLILPLSTEGGRLHLALLSPEGASRATDEVRFITGMEVSTFVAIGGTLEMTISAAYDARARGEKVLRGDSLDPRVPAPGRSKLAIYLPGQSPQDPATRARTGEIFASDDALQEGEDESSLAEAEIEELDEADAETLSAHLQDGDELSLEVSHGEDDGSEEVLETIRVGPKRVLVVDDEPDILRLLERSLKASGYAVTTAADGQKAEQALAQALPDLVLLDAMLPLVNGFEICSRIKSNPRLRKVPVIMMSAVYRGWRFAQDARDAFGADDYVEKPFHLADLLHRVEERLTEGTSKAPPEKAQAEALLKRGIELLEAKKPKEARVELEKAVKEDPFSPRGQLALARALVEVGDVFRAITAYERAIELRPNLFPALRNLAGLYLEKGFRRKAAEALERAMQHAPDPAMREKIRAQLLRLL